MRATAYVILPLLLMHFWTVRGQDGDYLDLLAAYARKHYYSVKTTPLPRFADYDFIVVGASPTGAAVANRLTENPKWTVLLLEAGMAEGVLNQVPFIASRFALSDYNWGYLMEPQKRACLGMTEGRCPYPRGKSLGGTSTLNYMIYSRGHKIDFDKWAEAGNYGWSYDDVLPYFKKSENAKLKEGPIDDSYHGKNGYVSVSHPPSHTPLAEAFLKSGEELGYHIVDYNGQKSIGFSYPQTTTIDGTRCCSAKAYLQVIRPNLDIVTGARVTKFLIDDDNKAHGVEFIKDDQTYRVGATKEVISSAGTIDSAKLLMLSGIGPKEHLRELGIKVIKDAKVGYNMEDHVGFPGLTFLVNQSVSLIEKNLKTKRAADKYALTGTGPFASPGGVEALAFVRSKYAVDARPDLELIFFPGSFNMDDGTFRTARRVSDQVYNAVWKPLVDKDTWSIWPIVQLPRSQGRLKLKSSNVLDDPILDPQFFDDPADLETLIEGIKLSIKISKTEAFRQYGSELHEVKIPGCEAFEFGSDDYWRCAIQHVTITLDHEMGTVKMGPSTDPTAVIDPELRVHGISGLRVIDASIIPKMPVGHPTATLYMIGEKGADLIKEAWKY